MKNLLLISGVALAVTLASCTSTTHEDTTTTSTVDTLTTDPASGVGTTPTTDVNGATPPDNTNGGISTGPSDASLEGTGVGVGMGAGRAIGNSSRGGSNAAGVNAAGSRSGTSVNTSSRAGALDDNHAPEGHAGPNSNTTRPESTYPEAKPGAPVNSRMPKGTSR